MDIKTKNNAQGMSDPREKMRPMIPAVEGIDINTPEIIPKIAVDLLKEALRSMTIEKINKVIASRTQYTLKAVPLQMANNAEPAPNNKVFCISDVAELYCVLSESISNAMFDAK